MYCGSTPPKMPQKFLQRYIEGEPEIETEIRQQLAVEKFKNETALQHCRAERYEQRFQSLDREMMAHITSKFKEEICDGLTRRWETAKNRKKHEEWLEEERSLDLEMTPAIRKATRNEPPKRKKRRGHSTPRGRPFSQNMTKEKASQR